MAWADGQTAIENTEDVIDSRQVIARIDHLSEREEDADSPLDDDEREELAKLRKLASQCEGYGDWEHGEALIRESYFETYSQELADDLGLTKGDANWPYTCIDWKQAARELRMDYTEVDFDGVSYFMRS